MYFSVKGNERRESISKRSIADVKLIQITIAVMNATNYGKKLKKNQDYGIPLLLFSTLPTEVTEICNIAASWLSDRRTV